MKIREVTVLVILCVAHNVKAKCVMRGICYIVNGFIRSCHTPELPAPSLPLELDDKNRDEIMTTFGNICPTFVYDDNGNQKPDEDIVTCCDEEQLLDMARNLRIAEGVLGRCPACYRNFARQICEMNCSPDQDRFVEVRTEFGTNHTEYIDEITYRVYEDFMLEAHSSCANVILPATGFPAINMMCGSAPVCDVDTWFGSTGDFANNPIVPVQVNFVRTRTMEASMNVHALACNETFRNDVPCGCIDCSDQCPLGMAPVVPEICTVLSVNCVAFSVGISFLVISVTFFMFLTVRIENKTSTKHVRRSNKMVISVQSIFSSIGSITSNNAILVIALTSWFTFAMLFGAFNLNITSNPIDLWSAPDSRSRQELAYFNSRFGPFYRASQVFLRITADPFIVGETTYGPAFRLEAIKELIQLEDAIIDIGRNDGGVTIEQVCYAPIRRRGGEQRLSECVVMSVSTFFGDDRHNINNETYLSTIQNCINNHYALDCLASWGGGSEPEITFGGYEEGNMLSADTLLINLAIANQLLEQDLVPILEWEEKFLKLMHDYEANGKPDYIELAFGAERSVEDEIRRGSEAEIIPIAISYLLMFIYVIFALGNIRSFKTWLLDSKVMVAIGSIIVVLISILCAIGVMGFAGVTITLLAINVIPFFVLSVGIDNVFLMVNTLHDIDSNIKSFDDYNENFNFEKRRKFVFSKMLGKAGPSMFVSSVTQITCFAIGTLANFPAVVTFAVFASLSLGFLFVFQITTVVAILSLDYKRTQQNRLDLFCCVQKKILNDDDPLNADTPHQGITKKLMEPYSKFLLHWRVKIIVATIFMIMLFTSVILIPKLNIGLDQEMALPTDSYVYTYLQALNDLMHLGPPVFFVIKGGLNYSEVDHQNTICGSQLCYEDSLTTQIFLASQHSNITYIARPSNSWIDDFFDWTSLTGMCCRYNVTDNSFCPSLDMSPECVSCIIDRNEETNGLRPAPEAFEKYFQFFLRDEPNDFCTKGGLGAYSSNVVYLLDSEGHASIHDSNFMTYHTNLRTSYDYITAIRYGYEISQNISRAISNHTGLDIEVFPYSVFYVFFEQYLTMWSDTFSSIGFCLLGALVFNLLASGFNFLTTFAVIFTAIMVVVNMMGVMYIWNIPLNAVSCVNLIVSIGIAVEFCSHIAYAFATSEAPRHLRVEDALKSVGATIITGITFTNIPIIVLAFANTQLIEVFFFRMFFSLVILGFIHGMIFFPVLLSYLNSFGKNM